MTPTPRPTGYVDRYVDRRSTTAFETDGTPWILPRNAKRRGDWVKIRTRVFGLPPALRWGILPSDCLGSWGLCQVLTHAGLVSCVGRDLTRLDEVPEYLSEFPIYNISPYALGRDDEGREVLADRSYRPICERQNGTVFTDMRGRPPFMGRFREFFWTEEEAPWLDPASLARCRAVLTEWGVRPRPWTGLDGVSGVERI